VALYKQSVDFLPKPSEEQLAQESQISKTGLYAAVLPLIAAVIWVIAMLGNLYYKNELSKRDDTIVSKQSQIAQFNDVRLKQTELVLKVDALKESIEKDFYPQKFFDDINANIKATGDAQATVYAYNRSTNGEFSIQGRANSYLDLAKIIVVFQKQAAFTSVDITSISFDRARNTVNFEISFNYTKETTDQTEPG
jgi:hypothetical protein